MPGKRGKLVSKSKFAQARTTRGWTPTQLATAAGVPVPCVVKAELRGRRTNEAVIAKVATALGVNQNALT